MNLNCFLQNDIKMKKKKFIVEEDDDFELVNIDINIVKNMLEFMNVQFGLAGFVINIFSFMGI